MSARRSATLALVIVTLITGLLFTASKRSDAGLPIIEAIIEATSAATSVSDDQTTWLHVLISYNGSEDEVTLPVTGSELANYLPTALSDVLLSDGEMLTENFEFVVAVLDFVGYDIDPYAIDEILILFAAASDCNWGCVKCCWSETCGCCCPEPEDDPGKGP